MVEVKKSLADFESYNDFGIPFEEMNSVDLQTAVAVAQDNHGKWFGNAKAAEDFCQAAQEKFSRWFDMQYPGLRDGVKNRA